MIQLSRVSSRQGRANGHARTLGALVLVALGFSCGSESTKTEDPITGPVLRTLIGTGSAGLDTTTTNPAATPLYSPQDLNFSEAGQPYLLDWNNHRLLTIENGNVRRIAGTGRLGDAPEGVATSSGLNHPTHVSFAPNGDLILTAWHNSKVMRLVLDTGMLLDECGNGQRSYGGDGGPASADSVMVNLPSSTIFDALGRMYISDQQNQRIRMVDESGIIRTIAGTGVAGFSGDGGPATAAKIRSRGGQQAQPSGRIALDPEGNLYIADTGNNLVRKVDTSGVITTVAGDTTGASRGMNAGFSGDGGPATSARLNAPSDVEIGPDGNLYIADTRNHCIRMVDGNGTITTVVGKGGNPGSDGDGRHATDGRLYSPYGIAFDPEGILYIADTQNHRVRYVSESIAQSVR